MPSQQIDVPGAGILEFPEGMSDDEIKSVIKRKRSSLVSEPSASAGADLIKPNIYDVLKAQSPQGTPGNLAQDTEFTKALFVDAPQKASELLGAAMQPIGTAGANALNLLGLATSGDQPAQLGGPKIIPAEPGKSVILPPLDENVKGILPSAYNFLSGVTTPEAILTLPGATQSKLLQAYFSAQAALGVNRSLQELEQAETGPEMQGAAADALLNATFAGLMARGLSKETATKTINKVAQKGAENATGIRENQGQSSEAGPPDQGGQANRGNDLQQTPPVQPEPLVAREPKTAPNVPAQQVADAVQKANQPADQTPSQEGAQRQGLQPTGGEQGGAAEVAVGAKPASVEGKQAQASALAPTAESASPATAGATTPAPPALAETTAKAGETQIAPVGMGAATPSEFQPPVDTTGIKNATVDVEREKRGLAPAMQPLRRSFGTVWDQAMAKIDRAPESQDALIKELKNKPRSVTDVEDAMLLHRQVDLQNDYAKTTRELAQAYDDAKQFPNRLADVEELKGRVAKLSDDLLDIYNINKRAGTETARGLSARRMMANEDFTLAAMETQRRAANGGKPLTPKQATEVKDLHDKIAHTQQALDEYIAKPNGKAQKDVITNRLRAENERWKQTYRGTLTRDRLAARTPWEKTQDTFVKWRRAFVLSGPTTLAKLTSAAVQRMSFSPVEEVIGATLGQLPGISRVAQRAPTEGGASIKAEAKAITEGFMAGMKDAWQILKTGKSDLELLHERSRSLDMPREAIDFIGSIHGALKAPTKRNAFARSFQKQVEFYESNGVDASDPLVQSKIAIQAYKDANRSIFLQDNRLIAFYKRGLTALEEKNKATGTVPVGSKALATTAKVLLPIVKIPTNIVAETFQYATGLVTGSARLANVARKGIETLTPEQADLIMRDLKKGSIGAAFLALGFLNPQTFGGYYQQGEKRKKTDVKAGTVRIYGVNIPSFLVHNPLLETLQIGATVRRVADSRLHKKLPETHGIGAGILASALGVTEEVPFIREQIELAKAFDPHERTAFFGELVKSISVPLLFQWLAQKQDVRESGEPIKRKPKTFFQHIETGIPYLRQNVPRASAIPKRRVGLVPTQPVNP